MQPAVRLRLLLCSLIMLISYPALAATPERNAYFGDTHVHTLFSFDAFNMNVRSTPDDAYRYAKGETIPHPAGAQLRLDGPPLDFLMVSDHAKFLGVFAAQLDTEAPFTVTRTRAIWFQTLTTKSGNLLVR